MKKRVLLLCVTFLLLLTGCDSKHQNDIPKSKQVEPPITHEEQIKKLQEQQKQWEEERKQQEKMNQDVINTMTIMIPAIM